MPVPENANGPPEIPERAAGADLGQGQHQQDSASGGDPKRLVLHWRLLLAASRDGRLSRGDLAVLGAVLDRFGENAGAWPALETIAHDALIARSTAGQGIQRLCSLGYLVRSKAPKGHSNLYRLGEPTSPERRTVKRSDSPELRTVNSPEVRTPIVRDSGLPTVRNSGPESASLNLLQEPASEEQKDLSLASLAAPAVNRFSEFWAVWPKRVDKDEAEKHWQAKKLDLIADKIIADVVARTAADPQWREKQYIPGPAKYLRRKRWEDEWRQVNADANHQQGRKLSAVEQVEAAIADRKRDGATLTRGPSRPAMHRPLANHTEAEAEASALAALQRLEIT